MGIVMKDNKNVVGIRVDANAVLGLGHLMRCMAFAYAMQETSVLAAALLFFALIIAWRKLSD